MFCAGLLSIGHFLLQIEQPKNQKHRNRLEGRVELVRRGKNGVIRASQYDTAYAPQFQLGCEFAEQSSLGGDKMDQFGTT
jgi:hypothetical protein